MASINLWGWRLGNDDDIVTPAANNMPSLVLKQEQIDDGAVTITQGSHVATYVDLEGSVRNEIELISRYREMALHPECSMAVDEIVTETITQNLMVILSISISISSKAPLTPPKRKSPPNSIQSSVS